MDVFEFLRYKCVLDDPVESWLRRERIRSCDEFVYFFDDHEHLMEVAPYLSEAWYAAAAGTASTPELRERLMRALHDIRVAELRRYRHGIAATGGVHEDVRPDAAQVLGNDEMALLARNVERPQAFIRLELDVGTAFAETNHDIEISDV